MDCAISQDRLFNEWSCNQQEPELLAALLGISPAQLADLTDDPAFIRRVAAWERLARARREAVVYSHQQAAAYTLRQAMASPDPIEASRAATVLARLCRNMQMPIAGGTSRRGAAQGGTALQSSASGSPTAPQEPSLPTPSSQPPLTPEPPAPSHPLTASPPLPFTASPPHIVTKLAALAALAGTAPVARASGP